LNYIAGINMQSEQETLSSNHDLDRGATLGNGWRGLPWGGFSLDFLRKRPWCPGVLLGEVSGGAVAVPSAQLIQWPAKAPGAHQARKRILLSGWLAQEVVWGEATDKYCLHVVFGSLLPARDSVSRAWAGLLQRLLSGSAGTPPES